jgi:chromate reductase
MSDQVAVICGTNRKDAISLRVTEIYREVLGKLNIPSVLIDLSKLPLDFAFSALYGNYGKNSDFNTYLSQMLESKKFVFVVPEYNGSFPGALKTFIDGLDYPNTFRNKKGALVGIASGGYGAVLALSHLSDIFNFCGMHVLAYKQRLERIEHNFSDGNFTNPKYLEMLEKQAAMFAEF